MKSQRRFSFAFKVATTVCCLIGILSNLSRTTSITSLLSFYTMQSNLFVLGFYISAIFANLHNPDYENTSSYHIFKGATIMVILLTFIVYNVSLQPVGFTMDVNTSSRILRFPNIFVHFLTPMMVFVDYLVFDEKGCFKRRYVPLWIIFPAYYILYVYLYAHFGGKFFGTGGSSKYAYYFLDIDKIGINGVICYIIFLAGCYILASLVLVWLDNYLAKRKKK